MLSELHNFHEIFPILQKFYQAMHAQNIEKIEKIKEEIEETPDTHTLYRLALATFVADVLHFTAKFGYEDVRELFLQHGANPNVVSGLYQQTPLHFAAKFGYENVTKLFLQHGANPNVVSEVDNPTPLHDASNKKIAELLIEHRADLTLTNKDGMTPYQYHAILGCYGHSIHVEIAHVIEDTMQLQGIAYTPYDCNEL
jgi:hypothetical protein